MKRYLLFLYAVAATATVSATDYCALPCKISPNGPDIPNIGCGRKEFAPTCKENAKHITLDSTLQKFLTDAHNEKRNLIAGGGNKKFEPACRMATMKWDNQLAELAALNVLQCEMTHDACHATDNFKFSGQNLYKYYQYPPRGFDHKELLQQFVDVWYNENKDCDPSVIKNLTQAKLFANPQKPIGHFTAMVREPNTRLGCAASTWIKSSKGTPEEKKTEFLEYYLLACNYATTNLYNLYTYATCKTGGQDCKSKNPAYPNLCAESEVYDVNDNIIK